MDFLKFGSMNKISIRLYVSILGEHSPTKKCHLVPKMLELAFNKIFHIDFMTLSKFGLLG